MTKRPLGPPSLLAAILLASSVSLGVGILPGTSFCGPQWQIIDYPPPTSLEPNEVIAYEHANFVGRYIRFKLQPGMRQLLVPGLPEAFNDVISSIQVGSNVAVMVFEDANFGDLEGHYRVDLVPHRLPFSDNILNKSEKVNIINDTITSLIVFPRAQVQPSGVMLGDLGRNDYGYKFYPLPESLDSTEAKYTHLPGMDDDANEVRVYPYDLSSPAFGKVSVTLYESPDFQGRSITLPGADGSMPGDGLFELGPYQFNDTASSLIVRWIGLPPLQIQAVTIGPPSTSTRVSAPSVPDTGRTPAPPISETQKTPSDKKQPIPLPSAVAPTGISGQWNSNIGAVYEIQQTGNQFTWSAPSLNQSGTGTISGKSITLSGPGWTVKGQITETDTSGNPTKIVGENGVTLFRAAGAAPGTPTAPSVISLAGQWKSALGLIYNITQQGSQFAWTVVNSDEKGQGTITGGDVSASWKGLLGSGSSSGKITVDSSGKAVEIKWNNGVRFYR
jgi:hypothetical protein